MALMDGEKARDASHSPPIDPNTLNLSPAPIPEAQVPISPRAMPVESLTPVVIPAATPTVAETGVPLSANASGPGPASGSLRDIRRASQSAGPRSSGLPGNPPSEDLYGMSRAMETASDEKKRLEREERERVVAARTSPTTSGPESAEDEKRRLEREERERVLASTASEDGHGDRKDGEELPPYQDIPE